MALTNDKKLKLFRNLVRAMTLDQMMMRLIRTGRLVGFYHEGGVALAPSVAAGTFLEKTDPSWPHLRGHGVAHLLSRGIDPKTYFAEHMGREAGCCKGRSSFHMSFPDFHIWGASGNIGANFPISVGLGFAAKHRKKGQIVMNCSGDGSYAEGRAHEAMLMAANWSLPIVFWCENNLMSQHSALADVFPGERISVLAPGYGIPADVVNGQDLFACGEAALKAIAYARSGKGPYMVECVTVRCHEHSVGSVNKAGTQQRAPELMAKWRHDLDPAKLAGKRLIEDGVATEAQIAEIWAETAKEPAEIEAFCEQSPRATPPIEDLVTAVYAA